MAERFSWSKPYCGLQHLQGLTRRYQISVEEHGAFAEAYVLDFHSPHAFTPIAQSQPLPLAEAQRWAERQAANLFSEAGA